MKVLPHTQETRTQYEILIQRSDMLPKIIDQKWWNHRVSMNEKIMYLEMVAKARSNFWLTVKKTYPEVENAICSATAWSISCEEKSAEELLGRE